MTEKLKKQIDSLVNEYYQKLMDDLNKMNHDGKTRHIIMVMPDGKLRTFTGDELKEYLEGQIFIK